MAEAVELAVIVHKWLRDIVRTLELGDEPIQLSLALAGERVEERMAASWPELLHCVRSFRAAFVEPCVLSVKVKAVDAVAAAVTHQLALLPRDDDLKTAAKDLVVDFTITSETLVRILEDRDPDYPPVAFSYPADEAVRPPADVAEDASLADARRRGNDGDGDGERERAGGMAARSILHPGDGEAEEVNDEDVLPEPHEGTRRTEPERPALPVTEEELAAQRALARARAAVGKDVPGSGIEMGVEDDDNGGALPARSRGAGGEGEAARVLEEQRALRWLAGVATPPGSEAGVENGGGFGFGFSGIEALREAAGAGHASGKSAGIPAVQPSASSAEPEIDAAAGGGGGAPSGGQNELRAAEEEEEEAKAAEAKAAEAKAAVAKAAEAKAAEAKAAEAKAAEAKAAEAKAAEAKAAEAKAAEAAAAEAAAAEAEQEEAAYASDPWESSGDESADAQRNARSNAGSELPSPVVQKLLTPREWASAPEPAVPAPDLAASLVPEPAAAIPRPAAAPAAAEPPLPQAQPAAAAADAQREEELPTARSPGGVGASSTLPQPPASPPAPAAIESTAAAASAEEGTTEAGSSAQTRRASHDRSVLLEHIAARRGSATGPTSKMAGNGQLGAGAGSATFPAGPSASTPDAAEAPTVAPIAPQRMRVALPAAALAPGVCTPAGAIIMQAEAAATASVAAAVPRPAAPPPAERAPDPKPVAPAQPAQLPPPGGRGPPTFMQKMAAITVQKYARRRLVRNWLRLSRVIRTARAGRLGSGRAAAGGRRNSGAADSAAALGARHGKAGRRGPPAGGSASELFTGRMHTINAVVVDDDGSFGDRRRNSGSAQYSGGRRGSGGLYGGSGYDRAGRPPPDPAAARRARDFSRLSAGAWTDRGGSARGGHYRDSASGAAGSGRHGGYGGSSSGSGGLGGDLFRRRTSEARTSELAERARARAAERAARRAEEAAAEAAAAERRAARERPPARPIGVVVSTRSSYLDAISTSRKPSSVEAVQAAEADLLHGLAHRLRLTPGARSRGGSGSLYGSAGRPPHFPPAGARAPTTDALRQPGLASSSYASSHGGRGSRYGGDFASASSASVASAGRRRSFAAAPVPGTPAARRAQVASAYVPFSRRRSSAPPLRARAHSELRPRASGYGYSAAGSGARAAAGERGRLSAPPPRSASTPVGLRYASTAHPSAKVYGVAGTPSTSGRADGVSARLAAHTAASQRRRASLDSSSQLGSHSGTQWARATDPRPRVARDVRTTGRQRASLFAGASAPHMPFARY